MKKWYFPYGMDIEKESVHNARIETFRDNILGSLARETCQNSLDVPSDLEKPIRIEFEEKEISLDQLLDTDSFINEIIPKAKETWENDLKAKEFLEKYAGILNRDNIRVLRISDYNTTGLKEANWESLIEKAGSSVKESSGSAGSFGIGKAAPFASSDLRMVFYSTQLENGDEKSIGVTKFVSFDNEDGSTAQGVGYLGEDKKEPIKKQTSFAFKEREESGTDIYIIGFNQNKDWRKTIIASLLESFLLSIYQEKIVMDVEGTRVDKDTMGELIKNLEGRNYDEIKNYYSVLEDPEMKTIVLDERFQAYGFTPEDGMFLLSKNEKANRSVLMTRAAGMKILDRKRISGSIQFNGIFQAKGTTFNEILKEMENPNHNDWIADRYEENPNKAKRLLRDIFQFMKEKVIENYEEKIEKQVDAFGISDFLPNNLREDDNKKDKKDGSLDSQINNIKLRTRKSKIGEVESPDEGALAKRLEKSGIIDGDEGGFGIPGNTDTKPGGREGDGGTGQPGGDNKEDESGEERVIRKTKKFIKSDVVSSRVLENDYTDGRYNLVFQSRKDMEKIKLELNLVGETGHGYKTSIQKATLNQEEIHFKKNYVVIDHIDKAKSYRVEFEIPYKERIKMEVRVYDYQ